jgi:serine/threonine protein kinase/WD40 repeat protein
MSLQPNHEVAVFSAARQLPAGERAAYLDDACAGDGALRQRVEKLLQATEEAGDFLQAPAPGAQRPAGALASSIPLPKEAPTQKEGDRIGRYKLLQQIGEGGCGVVYMAEQEEPVRRRVALKVIKLGMDTKTVIARFEAERQALALMDHPNIAKVLDAGATDTGRPYFVMELVRGVKITDYCDESHLSAAERLRLFIQVCQAIQHAHQKGIIHRDIKPSNILVTVNDGVAVPKVIDFGIAKATQGRLTDQTLFTAFEQFIGTPAYMSPEQAVMTSVDIDTRSDTYSLGVLLYELLTGRTPFDSQELLASGLEEMRRTIREQEPPRPSTRLSSMLAGELTTTAQRRQIEPLKLIHLVRGDLDWIVMKCLDKDRTRRYDTANGLAMDVQRYLADEPVVARPPSKLYEFQKTVRRHKFGFAAGAAIITVLAIGVVVSTWQAVHIARAHRDGTEKLFDSYLAQARLMRRGGNEGQRFESLDLVTKAAAIHASAEVRSEAIACLALTDVRFTDASESPDPDELWDAEVELRAARKGDGTISVRKVRDDSAVALLPSVGVGVGLLHAFSLDGRYLAAGYLGGRSIVWDIKEQQPVIDHLSGAISADFSADGRKITIACQDGQMRQFGLNPTLQLMCRPVKRYCHLRVRPQGDWFAAYELEQESLEARDLEVRDLRDGTLLKTLSHSSQVSTFAWSSDGMSLAVGCEDGRIVVWDTMRWEKQSEFQAHQNSVVSVGFSHSGSLLGSSSWDGKFRLWDLEGNRNLLTAAGWSYQVSFSADDRRIGYVQRGSKTGSLEVTPSSISRRVDCKRSRNSGSWSMDVSPDGRLVAAATTSGVHLWVDQQTKEPLFLPVAYCYSAIFTPDGANLIVCGQSGLARWPLRLNPGTTTDELRIGPRQAIREGLDLNYAALSKDGRWIAAANFGEDAVSIHELNNPSNHFDLVSQKHVQFPAFSPDGRWIAAGNWKGSGIKVWDFESRRIVQELPAASIAWSVFSPDGRSLATCSATCDVWDTDTWRRRYSLEPNRSEAHSPAMAFSPDARMLAVILEPNVVRLVAAETGERLANLEDPSSANISYLRFSSDGARLYALRWDQQIQVWDLRRIREELRKLKLDWNGPAIPPEATALRPSAKPLRISIVETNSP